MIGLPRWLKHLFGWPERGWGDGGYIPLGLEFNALTIPPLRGERVVSAVLTPETIIAPFPPSIVQRFKDWQACPWVHPLTCGNCESDAPLMVLPIGLTCERCGYLQERVPTLCAGPPPPSPREVLGLPTEE